MTAEPSGRKVPPIAALIAISCLSPFAINALVPSMPALERHFNAPYGRVQLVLSLFLAAIAAAQIGIGPLSDRFGRRPVLIAGLAVFTLASIAATAAPTIDVLIALRVVQGASGCVGVVLARAIVRDLFGRRRAASMLGYVTTGLAVAPMLAPSIGGVLQQTLGWRAIFWFMAGLGVACLAVTLRHIGETNRQRLPRLSFGTLFRSFGQLLGRRDFVLFTASTSLSGGVFFSFLGGAPLVAETMLGLSPTVYGLWFGLVALGYSAGSFLAGRFSERFGLGRMILGGSALALLSVLTPTVLFLAGLGSPAVLFLPMMVTGLANGLVLPSALSGAISVRPDIAGAASGLTGALQIGTGAVLTALAAALLEGGQTPLPMFAAMLAAAFAALGAALAIHARAA